jgi:hypothetical protein
MVFIHTYIGGEWRKLWVFDDLGLSLWQLISFALLLISSPVCFMIAVPKSPKSCLSRSFESYSRVSELDPCFLFNCLSHKVPRINWQQQAYTYYIPKKSCCLFMEYSDKPWALPYFCCFFDVFLSPFIFHSCILWWSCFKYTSMVSDQMWWF